ncbi:hypothetical protein A9404_03620 [Halothiobacillus diazotrophicus]|uniref:Uncharacterized protein n=2 Tax=Halothiobacillus diazotrophicus TaxID=1860122 RepID=A0A191ZK45_9GAMM|nr:hypothetical protein A9404_03620 [Halothiobacillus diazotrophicus]
MRILDDLSGMDAYTMTGNTLSIAANRISYTFDLHGPSMAVDTACSSSLVALHMACEALRRGEAGAALVGGVNMLMHPYPFVGFSKASMLSGKGRCRTFAAGGDGYVRSEGGAVLLIKTLEQAQRDGDRIHALIRGTGTNADGARKTGLTIPSPDGQMELIRSVLERTGLTPEDIDYIEAHGTGTSVGDPIETRALGQALGQFRPKDAPLPVGSIKSNLGHMEPASGMAGMVKAILTLKNREVPPSIHAATLNPDIDFAGLNLKVATESIPLTGRDRPLRVGINSFGFGGANAHTILEEAPAQAAAQAAAPRDRMPPLVFSARAEEALAEYARQYETLLSEPDADFPAIAHNAALRRDWLDQRCAVFGDSVEEIRDRLSALAAGESPRGVVRESALDKVKNDDGSIAENKVAFVYSGNGAQWLGMALTLRKQSPRFARTLDALDKQIKPHAGFSIIEELEATAEHSRMSDTAVAQPLLFAIQVGITELLRDDGIEADAAIGHSVGEVAAAWVTGIYTLEQAIDVVCKRSHAQAKTHGNGKMMAVGLSADAIPELIAEAGLKDDWIEIAAMNDPASVTLAGDPDVLVRFSDWLDDRGVFNRVLDLEYAFHSRAMDPIQAEILETMADLKPAAGNGRFVSTVTGDWCPGTQLTAQYWWHNVRDAVHFTQATEKLIDAGCRIFVEIGPNAILQRYLTQCAGKSNTSVRILPTQRKDADQWIDLNEAIHRIHLLRGPSSLRTRLPATAPLLDLPSYPWQRQHYWIEQTPEGYDLIRRNRIHPLLGYPLKELEAGWENTLDPETLPYLADHAVGGAVVMPGAGYAEMALTAAKLHFAIDAIDIEELEIVQPLVFEANQARLVRLVLTPRDGSFQILSRPRVSSDDWSLHAAGRVLGAPLTELTETLRPLDANTAPNADVVSGTEHYEIAERIGLNYGPAFQGLSEVRVLGDALEGTITLPESLSHAPDHLLHPAVLDLCFQALISHQRAEIRSGHGVTLLPVKIGRLQWQDTGRPITSLRGALRRHSPHSALADFELFDDCGALVVRAHQCRFRASTIQQSETAAPPRWQIDAIPKPHQENRTSALIRTPDEWAALASQVPLSAATATARQTYHQEISPLLDALVSAYVYETYADLAASGWIASHADQGLITPASRAMLDWMRDVLTRQGWLQTDDAGNETLDTTEAPPESALIWTTLMSEYPACAPEITLIGRVGRALPELIRGERDAGVWAAEITSGAQYDQVGESGISLAGTRILLNQTWRAILADTPQEAPLRILVIGSAQTGLIDELIPQTTHRPIELVITHPDAEQRNDLRSLYDRTAALVVADLDAQTGQLSATHALPAHFDLMLFPEGVHTLEHHPALLRQLRQKLAQGGLLLLAEQAPSLFSEFIHLTDDRWWQQQTATRRSPLRPASHWRTALSGWGYEGLHVRHESDDELQSGGYLVIAAPTTTAPAPIATETPETEVSGWLLLSGKDDQATAWGHRLAALLDQNGQRVALFAELDTLTAEDMSALLEQTDQQIGPLNHVVDLAALAGPGPMPGETGQALCLRALDLLHTLEEYNGTPPRLWWFAPGGALVGSPRPDANPASAALWGMARVAMNEYPGLDITLIDIPAIGTDPATTDVPPADDPLLVTVLRELTGTDPEREVILTDQGRFVPRMRPADTTDTATSVPADRYHLQFDTPGQLRNLKWRAFPERALSANEIEVQVKAVGLNFRDVMYAMGLLSDEAVENGFSGPSLGLEFSGVVSRIGAGVTHVKPGDDVLGFGPQCFASHVITHAGAVARKPENWSFAEAATVPTVFFTVYYALAHLAQLSEGERVLIHGAAGGVGIAAIEVARHLKAEIHATAGSDEKRDFVALMGVDHRYSSRDLAFADQIMSATGGQGIDVVLNSLAGEAINRNLHILRPFGRFLELGKRDFYENTHIGLRPFKDNLSYFGIDADQLMAARPELAAKLFSEVMALFHDGVLHPLPHRIFPAEQVVDAFRYMQQAKQIGKVVVTLETPPPIIEPARASRGTSETNEPLLCQADGSYLVSGGLTGFGFETARWLLQRGAGQVVLLGRRGLDTPGIADRLDELGADGSRVRVVACDVTDAESVTNVIQEIAQNGPALRGVIHAAMVLDDALVHNLDAERFQKAFAPKVQGAWNLHTATQNSLLDFFVVYSSATTFIGNPGQANYVAANGFLETLMHQRRAQHLPGTALCWGPLGDVGYLVDNQNVQEGLEARIGGKAVTASEALDALEESLTHDLPTRAVMRLDWHALERALPAASAMTFEPLRRTAGRAAQIQTGDIRALLKDCTPEEALKQIAEMLADEVAQVLGLSVERIDRKKSLFDMGLDSLMGVELALGIEKRFSVHMPAMVLNEGPTIDRLAERVYHHLFENQSTKTETQRMEDIVRHMAVIHSADADETEIAEMADMARSMKDTVKTS